MAALQRYRVQTAADLAAESDDGLRRELHDGTLYVLHPPKPEHSHAVQAMHRSLSATAPSDVDVVLHPGVHTGLRRFYVPDLAVIDRGTPFHDSGFDAGGVRLVVEIVEPGSGAVDVATRTAAYAGQGIPFLWRVDGVDRTDDAAGARLRAFRLDPEDETYQLVAELGPGERGDVAGPWTVSLDTADLCSPRSN